MADRRRFIVAFLAVALVGSVFATAGLAQPSPRNLYRALLTSRFSGLPSDFSSAKVGSDSLSDKDKRHHAVGAVLVTIDSEDAGIGYIVYPSRNDVAGRFHEPLSKRSGVRNYQRMGSVPGFRKTRSVWVNGTIEGKNVYGKEVRNGLTGMWIQKGNVVVAAFTVSTDNETSGDVPGTITLLRSGLAHLARVTARTR